MVKQFRSFKIILSIVFICISIVPCTGLETWTDIHSLSPPWGFEGCYYFYENYWLSYPSFSFCSGAATCGGPSQISKTGVFYDPWDAQYCASSDLIVANRFFGNTEIFKSEFTDGVNNFTPKAARISLALRPISVLGAPAPTYQTIEIWRADWGDSFSVIRGTDPTGTADFNSMNTLLNRSTFQLTSPESYQTYTFEIDPSLITGADFQDLQIIIKKPDDLSSVAIPEGLLLYDYQPRLEMDYFISRPIPVAAFSATPLQGPVPLTVKFTDQSTGEGITSRVWQYRLNSTSIWTTFTLDGTSSYKFSNTGSYDIKLTVTGTGGSDDEIKPKYISCDNQPPVLQILDAKMVSPDELGIGAIVQYPSNTPPGKTTTVTITGMIEGSPITFTYDLPQKTSPGGEWGRMVSVDINGKVLPTTPLRINLADQNIPRFTNNVDFTISGTASYEGSLQSDPSTYSGSILLPVIVIHGVTTNWIMDNFYPVVYTGLEDSLVKNGYIPDDEGYKTLWKVNEITYSSQDDTEQVVAVKMEGYIDQATTKTYAAKVNMIGHSLGGLIGRFVTTEREANRPDGPRVHKLIMIGTPTKGSTIFYRDVFLTTREAATALLTTKTNQSNLRQWLSPTYSNSLYEKSGNNLTVIPNPDLKLSTNILTNQFQKNGYDKPAPNGVTYFSIYNTKLSTPYGVAVTETKDKQWYKYAQTLTSGDGDKIVLAESAITYAISKPVSTNTGHGGLASDPIVIQQVLNCLQDQ
jgi:PKD repeat protein